MAITLPPETRKQLLASIKRYVSENLEQEVGDLQAGLLLDYFLKEIGPSVYNRAIHDAQSHLHDRVSDLEGVCFEKEFDYWPANSPRPRRP
jgi:uncharacterized protein (DUF2164 family)